MMKRLTPWCLLAAALVALSGCSEQESPAEEGSLEPTWTWEELEGRRLRTFDEWLASSGTSLSVEQQRQLEAQGYLFEVVPRERLPVRHRDGTVEVAPEAHQRPAALTGLDPLSRFEALWRMGLFDPADPVQAANAREFLAARAGMRTTRSELAGDGGATDAGAPDSGTADAGSTDAGKPDSGTSDSGTPDSGTPDAGVCRVTCNVLTSLSGDAGSNSCNCTNVKPKVLTDSKLAVTRTGTLTVACTFGTECTSAANAHVVGAYVHGTAACQGSSTVGSISSTASWSGGANGSASKTGSEEKSFSQTLAFTVGSAASGTSTVGAKASAGSNIKVEVDPGTLNVGGSAQMDRQASADFAVTRLYEKSYTTTAHTINFTGKAGGDFQLTYADGSANANVSVTAGGCSCSVVDAYWDTNKASVSDQASVTKDTGAKQCTCSDSKPCQCTVTGQ